MIDLKPLLSALRGRPLAVLGLGKTGLSVFAACRAAGIETVLWDDNAARREEARQAGGVIADLAQAEPPLFSLLCPAPGIPLTHPAIVRAQAAGIAVLGDIELFHRALPRAHTIGITGTNGKSTTTALTGHILAVAGRAVATGGNIGAPALSLPPLPETGVYVLELSSYQLELCPDFAPEIAVLVNLSPDHLDRHGTMENYAAVKARIFRGAGTGIVSLDDDWSAAIYGAVANAARKDIPVSCQTLLAAGVCVTPEGILLENGCAVTDLKKCRTLRGRHNWQNAAMAYAATRAAGVTVPEAIRGLESFPGLAHRQNIVAVLDKVSYVNDSKATNDESAAVALATFSPVYWIAGGKSKGSGYRACEKHLDHVRHAFLVGEAAPELAQWLGAREKPYTLCGTLDKAVAAAHNMAQRENLADAVVLLSPACASFDQFQDYEQRGNAFEALVRSVTETAEVKEVSG